MLRDPSYQQTPPKNTVRILTAEEVSTLNRDGASLQPDKFYAQFFLINSEPNNAADPYAFQIVPESLERIAKSAIGRPFVLGANSAKHVRGPKGNFSTPEEIIEYQKKFAAGEIVHEYINRQTGNANVIVEIFPEYVHDVKSGKIPPYVSPLIENTSANLERANGRLLVRNGRILHLQAVDTPGYGEVATIHGTCVGMLDNCMNELRALGASGTLKLSQSEETLVQSLADTGLKQDVAVAAEISQSKQPTIAQRNAEIIADFEVRTRQITPDQREARIAELLDSGEDLSSLANYLQGQSLKMGMRNETMGAAAPKRVLTARDIVEHPKFKELQSTVQDLKKAYGIAEKDTKSTEPVGFALENSMTNPYRNRIVGAAAARAAGESPSQIRDPVGFELEDNMMSRRKTLRGKTISSASGAKGPVGFELEDSMWR